MAGYSSLVGIGNYFLRILKVFEIFDFSFIKIVLLKSDSMKDLDDGMKKKKRGIIKRLIGLVVILCLGTMIFFGIKMYRNIDNVMNYRSEVETAVVEAGIPQYENLALAIIYTETKGQAADVMQSSESAFGNQFVIDDPAESIRSGVDFLASAIQKAAEAGCDLATAVQAYNFGLDYIDYVKANGGENSVKLAEAYSKDVLSPLLGNDNQETYSYYRPQSLLYNGGFLYKNGGNFFYADIVKMNEKLIDGYLLIEN